MKKVYLVCGCAMTFLILIIISLMIRLNTAEHKIEILENQLSSCGSKLADSEADVMEYLSTIEELQIVVETKDADIQQMLSEQNASLFDQYFSAINFENLSYREIREINKMYSICMNDVQLSWTAQHLELNRTLVERISAAYENEKDKTMRLVLQTLLKSLQDDIERLIPIHEHFVKEHEELKDYDAVIPMPIG